MNTELIVRHWDDLLRVAGSLKMGTISASELTRSLLRSNRPSTLARAMASLGRVAKTLYLLAYLDDETYRRRILTQLNRGEGRHGVARAVFHGQRGELRQRYREGQEDQLGAWAWWSMLVLWNTLYMDAALNQLRTEGMEVLPRRCRAPLTARPRTHQFPGTLLVCPRRICGTGSLASSP